MNSRRYVTFGCVLAAVILAGHSLAEHPAKPAVPPAPAAPTEAEMRARIEQTLKAQEARVEALANEFFSADEDLERQVDGIVNHLASMKDSYDSKTKITVDKQKLIEGLATSIKQYKNERRQVQDELRRPERYRADTEDLKRHEEFVDEKITKRVDQIMKLVDSLEQHQDFARYRRTHRYDGRGYVRPGTIHKNEAYKHNKQQSQRGDKVRGDVFDGLQKEIKALETRNRLLQSQVGSTRDPEQKDELNRQITGNNKRIAALQADALKATMPPSGGGQKVGSYKSAQNIEKLLGDAVNAVVADRRELDKLKAQLGREIDRLNRLQKQAAVVEQRLGAAPAPVTP